ncbi:DUF983 domain-containing protein [Flavobacterium sp.]|jgi:uncharacterized protein (DUF983 family)|uniref:DUF983 domain-containing protein n=1 Tax=Flavobacterium sp. TaxID=239 RepID=UPI0037C0B698
MLKKGSKLNSILTGTCPRCQEESMYVDKNPYNIKNIYKMHDNCSHCGLHYQIEPSFFYGAMYVSYGLTVGIGIAAFIISKVIIGLKLNQSMITIILALVVLMPITARLSRNIYINMFVSYNKDVAKK